MPCYCHICASSVFLGALPIVTLELLESTTRSPDHSYCAEENQHHRVIKKHSKFHEHKAKLLYRSMANTLCLLASRTVRETQYTSASAPKPTDQHNHSRTSSKSTPFRARSFIHHQPEPTSGTSARHARETMEKDFASELGCPNVVRTALKK